VPVKKILWSESIRARVEQGGGHFLERASLRALSAGRASVLLDVAASDRPDLIILPIEAMEMPAAEVCRRIREDARTRSIPILALGAPGNGGDDLRKAGCTEVLDAAIAPQLLQEKIAGMLGMRLRRYPRYPVILPVSRGRFFHEFLGYSNALSEGGMGFDTLARLRERESLALRIYRNSEEKPIGVMGRVAGVRPSIDAGVGYAIGVEFMRLAGTDRQRLLELFPQDPCVTWGPDEPAQGTPPESPPRTGA
jgi:CheY-like chemotaxis protein